jgi:NAD(P)-dependent dehydrogenase (short-subunit alcohol dehydrogenase family)
MRLKDQVAIVTGGGRGLGREIALAFAQEGARLVISGTSISALESVAQEITSGGGRAISVPADVAVDDDVARLVSRTLEEFGQIDILVNNAGIAGPTALVTEVKREDWDRTLAVNLTGAFLCAQAVLPNMAERRRGKIINIASVAGHLAYPLRSPYAVSKWGMIGLSRTLAAEWGKYNIQVNTISPGPVRGERIDEVISRRAEQMGRSIEEMTREVTARLALGRFVEPEQIAAMAVFLASSAADTITGEAIQVSSGVSLS